MVSSWFPPRIHGPWPTRLPVDGSAPPLPAGSHRWLVWNVQYAAGRGYRFFYDDGPDVAVARSDVYANLRGMDALIREAAPDFALLQEVDRRSRRTGEIDEHRALTAAGGWPCHVTAPYHRVRYVPVPLPTPLGGVDFHLSVLSRWQLEDARRTGLPLLREGWVRRQFNLRRAILEVDVPIAGGGRLRVLNTHLSAFARGDGSLEAQVDTLADRMRAADATCDAWILAGDLNALPPGDDAARLGPDARDYPEATSPLVRLYDQFASAVPAAAHTDDPAPWRTYLPPGADEPDRAIDHVFYGGALRVDAARVLRGGARWSDHLPIVVDARL